MVQDKYLIEFLLRNGYKLENIKSDKFKVKKVILESIVLSKITNLEDLAVFSGIVPTFIIDEESAKSQTYNELDKVLKKYSLKAKTPNLKLENIKFNAKVIIFNGFDLSNTTYDCTGGSDISFMHCSNLDISTIANARISIFDMEDFDLACVGKDIIELNCLNIDRVYLSEDTTSLYRGWFRNCTFDNTEGNVLTLVNGIEFINANFLTDALMFRTNWVSWRNLDFEDLSSILKIVDAKFSIDIHNMSGIDETIEEFLAEDILQKIRLINPKGYDERRLKTILDLNKNIDLLESYENLSKVLKNNKHLKRIIVTETLTAEQRKWLKELARDKEYTYVNFDKTEYMDSNNTDIISSYDDFIKADEIFKRIVNGVNPSWNEIEKFKYIYTKLGELISYDINVLYADEVENYNRANLITRDIFKSILTGKGVCSGFAEAYQYVCRKAGLMCYTERDATHEYNIIKYHDENCNVVKSYCDLTWDSERIKRKQKCMYFGKSKETFKFHTKLKDSDTADIPEEKIEEIDEVISYEKETYYQEIINKAIQIENKLERTEFIIQEMMNVESLSLMTNNEIVRFAMYLLVRAKIDKKEVGITKGFAGKDNNELNDPRLILWLKDNKRFYYWTFNKDKQKFVDLDKDTLEELILSGMLEFYGNEEVPQISSYKRESDLEH